MVVVGTTGAETEAGRGRQSRRPPPRPDEATNAPPGGRPPPGWVGKSDMRGTIEKETRPAWGVSFAIVLGEKSLGLRPPAVVLVYG